MQSLALMVIGRHPGNVDTSDNSNKGARQAVWADMETNIRTGDSFGYRSRSPMYTVFDTSADKDGVDHSNYVHVQTTVRMCVYNVYYAYYFLLCMRTNP